MALAEVSEVIIDSSGGYKFIVAKLIDGNGGEKLVVRAKEECCDYHNDILYQLQREVIPSGLLVRCIGGRIKVNPDEKTIHIWGDSSKYGQEPNRQLTVRMLQGAFPEFQVTAN